MSLGSIDIKLRPLRLAFLLSPLDKQALLKAIEINSFLWGGVFNPIIPFYRRAPKAWEGALFKNITGKDIVRGYIKGFDPDFIVPIGEIKNDECQFPEKRILSPDKIISGIEKDGTPCYGIGIFEILQHVYNKELKFIRKEPLRVLFPKKSPQFNLFLSSYFGSIPKLIDDIVKKNFDDALSIDRPIVTINNYINYSSLRNLFPRRLTMTAINPLNPPIYIDSRCIFFMDASSALDMIDYWNLRASGWDVIPVARQIYNLDDTKSFALRFIEDNFIPYHNNPDRFHKTKILKSRSVNVSEFEIFTKSLNINQPKDPDKAKYTTQHWYPRMWDDWARNRDGVGACKLDVREEKHDLQRIPEHISLRTIDPEFAYRYGGHGTYRYANEVDIRVYGDEDNIFAEVIPQGIEEASRFIRSLGFGEWRISEEGLVFLSAYTKFNMTLHPLLAEDVMSSWLKSKGWSVKMSSPGLIACQMLKQLGGSWGVAILSIPGLVELLNDMSAGKSIQKRAFWGKMQKIVNNQQFPQDPKALLKRLTELKIIRLGIDIQCPACQQRSWHALSDFSYKNKCPICLNQSDIPSHSTDDIKWSYRSFGSFSLPRQAFGVYTVLLTHHFFTKIFNGATTPLMSFEANKNDKRIEADLALFYQKTEIGRPKRELLFAECKSLNRFEKIDIERMKTISKEFPGSIIIFSTLNSSLTEKEKRLIRPLAKQGRKYRKDGRTSNPVLILTATELYADISLSNAYEEKKGRYAEFGKDSHNLLQIRPLCDITQQLYLDMEPWEDWFFKEKRKGKEHRTD